MAQHVIVDVDAGSDDALALLMLLVTESLHNHRIVGVTCTHGNTHVDAVCTNVLRTLESIDRLDVPVFAGACSPLLPRYKPDIDRPYTHGEDGFGDCNWPPLSGQVQQQNAVVALNDLATVYKDVTLVCLGPLTNIALAVRTYKQFSSNVSSVYIMGGSTDGTTDFNFFSDTDAAQIVLSTMRSVTLLPLKAVAVTPFSVGWRFNVLGQQYNNKALAMLNKAERKLYQGRTNWRPCDAFCAALLVSQELYKSEVQRLKVILQGSRRGQTEIVETDNEVDGEASVVTSFDFLKFEELLRFVLCEIR